MSKRETKIFNGEGCDACLDPDGENCFPIYGVAPHTHVGDQMIGSTRLLPRTSWPENFRPDPNERGHGVYTHCPKCGAGEKP
jgi:hypothetical protein